MTDEIAALRQQLDSVDGRILQALAERQKLVLRVAQTKAAGTGKLHDPQREQGLLTRLVKSGKDLGLDRFFLTRVFREILDHSVRLQQDFLAGQQNPQQDVSTLVVGFQGTETSYSHMAAMRHFGSRNVDVIYVGYPSFETMLRAVIDGQANYAVLPIENTTAGSINESYDLLAKMALVLVGEEVQRVEHCLMSVEGSSLNRIRRVFSHPQALAQCSEFLASLQHCRVEAFSDTALAAQKIADDKDPTHAAIASAEAAQRYGLTVLRRHIANQRENFTRMVIVAREPVRYDLRVPCKTSLIFSAQQDGGAGALLSCLEVFARHQLSLSKIESRPRSKSPWQYLFYVDLAGNLAEPRVQQALRELEKHTSWMKILGSYPTRTTDSVQPAEPLPTPQSTPRPLHNSQLSDRQPNNRQPTSQSGGPPTADGSQVLTNDAVATAADDRSDDAVAAPTDVARTSITSRTHKTVVHIGRTRIGGGPAVILAAPTRFCDVTELNRIAELAKENGITVLCTPRLELPGPAATRAETLRPASDPRPPNDTHLSTFEAAAERVRLATLCRIGSLAALADYGRRFDALFLAPEFMRDLSLLEAVGQSDRPVVLSRHPTARVDEWLAAAELILAQGNQQVILCEGGASEPPLTSGVGIGIDLAVIAALKGLSHLPVIVDLSHHLGATAVTIRLAKGALALGADGLLLSLQIDEPAETSAGLNGAALHELMLQLV